MKAGIPARAATRPASHAAPSTRSRTPTTSTAKALAIVTPGVLDPRLFPRGRGDPERRSRRSARPGRRRRGHAPPRPDAGALPANAPALASDAARSEGAGVGAQFLERTGHRFDVGVGEVA